MTLFLSKRGRPSVSVFAAETKRGGKPMALDANTGLRSQRDIPRMDSAKETAGGLELSDDAALAAANGYLRRSIVYARKRLGA
jgi:hypothetical protein